MSCISLMHAYRAHVVHYALHVDCVHLSHNIAERISRSSGENSAAGVGGGLEEHRGGRGDPKGRGGTLHS